MFLHPIRDQLTPGSHELQRDANALRRGEFIQGPRVRENVSGEMAMRACWDLVC